MSDVALNAKKMNTLMGLGIPSLIQIDDTTAMLKLPPAWELMIDVSTPTYEWKAKSQDRIVEWKNPSVPDDTRETIRRVTNQYNDVLINSVEWRD